MERQFSDRPRFTPAFMVNDYIAGNLGNAGVIAAFRRRAREGGSHHVRVNLSRCAMWPGRLTRRKSPTRVRKARLCRRTRPAP